MNKFKVFFIIIALIALGITGFLFFQKLVTNTQDTTAVVTEMRSLNRWETASFTIEKIIDSGTDGNVFQQFLFGNRILLIAQGNVIAGFDLSHFSQDDITIQGTSIELKLPAPQILVASIDNTKTKVYDRKQGLLVPSDNNLESTAFATAQNSVRAAACQEGILAKASANAKSQLTSLFSSFHFTKITIIIPQGHC